jgi:hypothetical protein
MLAAKPKRAAAALAALLVSMVAGTARADSAPGSYAGHGVAFSYPTDWLNMPGQIVAQQGTALWKEFFGPVPQPQTPPSDSTVPPPQPSLMSTDVVVVAGYRIPFSITKKNIAKYKPLVRLTVQALLAQVGGNLVGGPVRITMGKLPAYRVDATATVLNTPVEFRLVFAFRGHSEYFLNCQNTQNGPLSAEIKSGCDQIVHSFQLVAGS